MTLSRPIFLAMQNASNQVCFTLTPHSTDIKTIIGPDYDCGGQPISVDPLSAVITSGSSPIVTFAGTVTGSGSTGWSWRLDGAAPVAAIGSTTNGNNATIVFAQAAIAGQVITISYDGSGDFQVAGQDMGVFVDFPVVNNIP